MTLSRRVPQEVGSGRRAALQACGVLSGLLCFGIAEAKAIGGDGTAFGVTLDTPSVGAIVARRDPAIAGVGGAGAWFAPAPFGIAGEIGTLYRDRRFPAYAGGAQPLEATALATLARNGSVMRRHRLSDMISGIPLATLIARPMVRDRENHGFPARLSVDGDGVGLRVDF
jgi:hypothetical protein